MNVTALVDVYDGAVVERYIYDAYGKVTVLHGLRDNDGTDTSGSEWSARAAADDFDNEILYCGYRYDPETGLYQVRNRYYHPTLGRWVSRDPIGYADGMNVYEYVASCPITYLDAQGREIVDLGERVIGTWTLTDLLNGKDFGGWWGRMIPIQRLEWITDREKTEVKVKDDKTCKTCKRYYATHSVWRVPKGKIRIDYKRIIVSDDDKKQFRNLEHIQGLVGMFNFNVTREERAHRSVVYTHFVPHFEVGGAHSCEREMAVWGAFADAYRRTYDWERKQVTKYNDAQSAVDAKYTPLTKSILGDIGWALGDRRW